MSAIRKLLQGGQAVAYYPQLARAVGGIAPALFLQQIAHWEGKSNDGWVFRTTDELEEELAMSYKVQANCRKHLIEGGFLEEDRRAKNRLHYRIDWDKIEAALQSCPKGKSRVAQSASPELPKGKVSLKRVSKENKEEENVRANALSGKPQSAKPVSLEKYHTDRIYQAMRESGNRLSNEQYTFHLGRAKDMLAKDNPTDEELEALPDAFKRHWTIKGWADAPAALNEIRRQKARDELINESKDGPAAWEPVNPHGEQGTRAREKPYKPYWYATFFSCTEDQAEELIESGMNHREILDHLEGKSERGAA